MSRCATRGTAPHAGRGGNLGNLVQCLAALPLYGYAAVEKPNHALVAPRYAQNLGMGESSMKLVFVPQWVRLGSSPTRPTPSQQVRSELRVHSPQSKEGAGGASRQDA